MTNGTERQVAHRPTDDADSASSDRSLTTEAQAGAPLGADGTLSVRLLVAPEHDQDAAVLSVHGEIDLGTAPVLREVLLSVLEQDTGAIVVDLSEVPFMDSTGVHVLLDTLQRLKPQNRGLAIV